MAYTVPPSDDPEPGDLVTCPQCVVEREYRVGEHYVTFPCGDLVEHLLCEVCYQVHVDTCQGCAREIARCQD